MRNPIFDPGRWLPLLFTLGLAACEREDTPTAATDAGGRPPNVLFLFADDQRPDTIAAFGNEHIRTPNLDQLAARGHRFANNYCMGSIHGAVCQPSRAMILTGRTLYRVPMDLAGMTTLPQLLGERGYATFGTGKWHNGADAFTKSFQQGRAVMLGGMSDHTAVPIRDMTDDGGLTPVRTGDKFSSELFADAAIQFLREHDEAEPFFCYVAFTAPHDPRQPPQPYRDDYYEARPPLPANYMPQHPFDNGWMVGRDEYLAAWPRTEEVVRDQLAEYYGLITHLDAQVGRILAALEARGLTDNTIVVYTADHGLAVGSHGLMGKQNVYEHSMGCPLLIAGPDIPAGESAALTYLYDLFPTLCGLTDTTPPAGVEGRDLAPLWRGERESVRDSLFLTYENSMRAVRDARYKLIRYPRVDHRQLFDLQEDPDERHDIAAAPEHAERVARMTELMRDWQRRTDDPHPLEVDEPEPMEIDLTGRARKPDRWQPQWIIDKYFGEQR